MPLTLSDGALSVIIARELRCDDAPRTHHPKELLAHSNFLYMPAPEVLLKYKAMVLFFIISYCK